MLPLARDMDGMSLFSVYRLQKYYCDMHNAGVFLADYTFDARRLPAIISEMGGKESFIGAQFTIERVSQRLVLNYFEDAFFVEFAALNLCKDDPPSCDLFQTEAGHATLARHGGFLRSYITLISLVRASLDPEDHEFYQTDCAFNGRPPLSFEIRKADINSIHLAAERHYTQAIEQALDIMPFALIVNSTYPPRLLEALGLVELVDLWQRTEHIPWATQAKVALLRAALLHTETSQINPDYLVRLMAEPKGRFVADVTSHAVGLSAMGVFLCWAERSAEFYPLADLVMAIWSMVASLLEQVLLYLAILLHRHGNLALAREMRALALRLGLALGRFKLPAGAACNFNSVGVGMSAEERSKAADTSYADLYVFAGTARSSCCRNERFDVLQAGACPASVERFAEHECDVR